MADYQSKRTGEQIEALLDIVSQGGGGTITEAEITAMGFTKNLGTITEVKVNGVSKGTSGVVDLDNISIVYITDFSEADLFDLSQNNVQSIQFHIDELKQALAEQRHILVPMGNDLDGYGVLVGFVEDMLYLSVRFGTGYSYQIEVNPSLGIIYGINVQRRDYVDEKSLKTINGQSLVGSGDIQIGGGTSSDGRKEVIYVDLDLQSTINSMRPNVVYWCAVDGLTIESFEDPIIGADSYDIFTAVIQFGVDEDNVSLTLPDYVLWVNGKIPEISTGLYELSISRISDGDGSSYFAVLTQFKPVE